MLVDFALFLCFVFAFAVVVVLLFEACGDCLGLLFLFDCVCVVCKYLVLIYWL